MSQPPNLPQHADKIERVPGADPRFTIRRHLAGYAYPQNGNVHNPTPRYMWWLLLDGKFVDASTKRRDMAHAARTNGPAYIEGF